MKKLLLSSLVMMMILLTSMTSTVWAESSRGSVFVDLSLSSQFYEPVYSMYLKEVYEGEETDAGLMIHP